MSGHTIVLVEDDVPTRERIAEAIAVHPELDLRVAAGSVAEGRAALADDPPDVLLTDLGLPDGDGTELIRAAAEAEREILPMVITVFGDERHVVAALEAGALGYLLKDGSPEYIARSILDLVAGGSPISSPIARYLLGHFGRPAPARPDAPHLSDREKEVLTHIVKGFSYGEVARLLDVSPHTVTTHVRRIYRKLAVRSRGEAVYEAVQLGIVTLKEE